MDFLSLFLKKYQISQNELGRRAGISSATMSRMRRGMLSPPNVAACKERLRNATKGFASPMDIDLLAAFLCIAHKQQPTEQPREENPMFLRRQTLLPETRKKFGLFRDPFTNDIRGPDDLWLSPDIRYIREEMRTTAQHGGMLAVVGESGAGKSTLRRDLVDWVAREHHPITVIEPASVIGMEGDSRGRRMMVGDMVDATIAVLHRNTAGNRGSESKTRHMHKLLIDSRRAGFSHVLVIEEAHSLPMATLKHLKRFSELEDGYTPLLGIILIGQPELLIKLNERQMETREVTQRCQVVELPPISRDVPAYLKFKLDRIGRKAEEIFDDSAYAAITARLAIGGSESRAYPLVVGNMAVAAMNICASIGAPRVTADMVKRV